MAIDDVRQAVDKPLSGKNMFYAVKVQAVFDYSTVRTEPRQKKPYPPLVAVAKRQPVYVRGYVRA